MANEGSASTNGSQFFIVYKDSTSGTQRFLRSSVYTVRHGVHPGSGIVQNVAKGWILVSVCTSLAAAFRKKKVIVTA